MSKLASLLSDLVDILLTKTGSNITIFLEKIKEKLAIIKNKQHITNDELIFLGKLKTELVNLIPCNNSFEKLLDEFAQAEESQTKSTETAKHISQLFSDCLLQEDKLFHNELTTYLKNNDAIKTYNLNSKNDTGALKRVFTNYKATIGTAGRLLIFLANNCLVDKNLIAIIFSKKTYQIFHESLDQVSNEINNYCFKSEYHQVLQLQNIELIDSLKIAYMFYLVSLFLQNFPIQTINPEKIQNHTHEIGSLLNGLISVVAKKTNLTEHICDQQAKIMLNFLLIDLDNKQQMGKLQSITNKNDNSLNIYNELIKWSHYQKTGSLKLLRKLAQNYTFGGQFKNLLIAEVLKFVQQDIFTTKFKFSASNPGELRELFKPNKNILKQISQFFNPTPILTNTIPQELIPILDTMQADLKNNTFVFTMDSLITSLEKIINDPKKSYDLNMENYQTLFKAVKSYKEAYDNILTITIQADSETLPKNTNLIL